MSWLSIVSFSACFALLLSFLRKGTDVLSPARLFCVVWTFSIALTELKLSALQHQWETESWMLLVIGLGAFLIGILISYVINIETKVFSLAIMRAFVRQERVHEGRLFWLVCASLGVYSIAYAANYLIRGWLPVEVIGLRSRVDFNVSGLTLFLYAIPYIVFITLLYNIFVRGNVKRKVVLTILAVASTIAFLLLLQRYQLFLTVILCFTLLYYSTNHVRLRTTLPLIAALVGFFYWMSSLRITQVASAYFHSISKIKLEKQLAFLTEPYMYFVTNLENFARSVSKADYHTFGYFTFDFVTAMTGLKYWVLDYFSFERTPHLISGYNTYTAFWWFYSDFGVIGLALIPLLLGFGIGALYYRMRSMPTIKNVTTYGVMVFVILISYFNFPLALLWVNYNLLALYLVLRWTVIPRERLREA